MWKELGKIICETNKNRSLTTAHFRGDNFCPINMKPRVMLRLGDDVSWAFRGRKEKDAYVLFILLWENRPQMMPLFLKAKVRRV